MAMTDPLGDMLTRIRNGQQAKKDSVLSPASKLRVRVLEVLQREGYIRGLHRGWRPGLHPQLRIELKYFRRPARNQARGARIEAGPPGLFGQSSELPDRSETGLASPSSQRPAACYPMRRRARGNVGGEVLAEVF